MKMKCLLVLLAAVWVSTATVTWSEVPSLRSGTLSPTQDRSPPSSVLQQAQIPQAPPLTTLQTSEHLSLKMQIWSMDCRWWATKVGWLILFHSIYQCSASARPPSPFAFLCLIIPFSPGPRCTIWLSGDQVHSQITSSQPALQSTPTPTTGSMSNSDVPLPSSRLSHRHPANWHRQPLCHRGRHPLNHKLGLQPNQPLDHDCNLRPPTHQHSRRQRFCKSLNFLQRK